MVMVDSSNLMSSTSMSSGIFVLRQWPVSFLFEPKGKRTENVSTVR